MNKRLLGFCDGLAGAAWLGAIACAMFLLCLTHGCATFRDADGRFSLNFDGVFGVGETETSAVVDDPEPDE